MKKIRTTRAERSAKREATLSDRASLFTELAGKSKRARLLSQVEEFAAIPSGFTSLNRATTVGGAPLSCLWTIHGPSGSGKTTLLVQLMRNFQAIGGIAAFVDAEQAADTKRWLPGLGINPEECLYIGRASEEEALDPLTFEEIVEEVDGLIDRYRAGKKAGSIAMGTPMIIGVDSISKMVPGSLFKKLDKDGGDALRGGVGRMQALLNTAWMAEIGAKIGDEPILFAVIAHEMEKEAPGGWGQDFKVRGGGSIIYDSMMQVRVTFAGLTKDLTADGAPAVGKRHGVQILKNKHGPSHQRATFYTSNGQGTCPAGFDRAREVLHEGIQRGMIEGPDPKSGITLGSKLAWKGRKLSLKALNEDGEVLNEIAKELDEDARKGS